MRQFDAQVITGQILVAFKAKNKPAVLTVPKDLCIFFIKCIASLLTNYTA